MQTRQETICVYDCWARLVCASQGNQKQFGSPNFNVNNSVLRKSFIVTVQHMSVRHIE